MRAGIIALSALLLGGLLSSADAWAGKFGPGGTGNKLNDKALVRKSGGRTGVGGVESVMFPTKHPANTAQSPKK